MFHPLVIAMSSATVPVRVAIPGVSDTRTCLGASRRISRLGMCPLRRIATPPRAPRTPSCPEGGIVEAGFTRSARSGARAPCPYA